MAISRTQTPRSISTEDAAPVSDAVLSRLYRAELGEIAEIIAPLSDDVRSSLAAFCYGRAHLRAIGREIARHCNDASLRVHAGGGLGASLVEAKRTPQGDQFGAEAMRHGRPKVRLATAADMARWAPRPALRLVELD